MIRLITATPGSGKTCLVVEWLIREVERGFYKEFYTNIEGLRICGVRPLPADCDWRTLNPEKDSKQPPKLVIIDECQYIDAFMKENRSANNRIGKDLSTHRHYGIDIWFITQSVKLLNDYVLENVGEHVHLYRPRKRKSVTVYWWSYVQKSLTKSAFKDADDMQVWRLNPAMFDYYKSTSAVTDSKARISKKVVTTLISFVLIMCVIGYLVSRGLDFYTQATVGDVLGTDKAVSSVVGSQVPLESKKDDDSIKTVDNLKIEDRKDDEESKKDDEESKKDDSEKDSIDKMLDEKVKVDSKEMPSFDVPSYNPPSMPSFDVPSYNPPSYNPPSMPSFDVPSYNPPSMPSVSSLPVQDEKPAMMFYSADSNFCLASNKSGLSLNIDADKCNELLQKIPSN